MTERPKVTCGRQEPNITCSNSLFSLKCITLQYASTDLHIHAYEHTCKQQIFDKNKILDITLCSTEVVAEVVVIFRGGRDSLLVKKRTLAGYHTIHTNTYTMHAMKMHRNLIKFVCHIPCTDARTHTHAVHTCMMALHITVCTNSGRVWISLGNSCPPRVLGVHFLRSRWFISMSQGLCMYVICMAAAWSPLAITSTHAQVLQGVFFPARKRSYQARNVKPPREWHECVHVYACVHADMTICVDLAHKWQLANKVSICLPVSGEICEVSCIDMRLHMHAAPVMGL